MLKYGGHLTPDGAAATKFLADEYRDEIQNNLVNQNTVTTRDNDSNTDRPQFTQSQTLKSQL